MKLFFDLLPVLLFFVAYKFYDIYVATTVAIVTAIVQVIVLWFRDGKIPTMHWVTLGLLVFFGGLTIMLQDPLFIKWKPTIVNWLFAAAFVFAPLFSGKTLPQRMIGANVKLESQQWKSLNAGWILFFIFLGALNLAVAFNFSENTWVNFKLFGLMGLTFIFALAQGFYIARHIQEPIEKP